MRVCATLPAGERDVRLDLFRGLANWAIFPDRIPPEVLSWVTTRNYGFSDHLAETAGRHASFAGVMKSGRSKGQYNRD